LQQLEQFSSRHEQFAPQHTAGFYFLPLNKPIHGVIIDAEHIGGFLHGIGQPLSNRRGRRGGWL
jgi:hypothetical protein